MVAFWRSVIFVGRRSLWMSKFDSKSTWQLLWVSGNCPDWETITACRYSALLPNIPSAWVVYVADLNVESLGIADHVSPWWDDVVGSGIMFEIRYKCALLCPNRPTRPHDPIYCRRGWR